jgi:O-antigen/teichoic acid export membrane protein
LLLETGIHRERHLQANATAPGERTSRKRYIGGAAVQVSITLALATQAFFAPRILGTLEYGRTVAALALPILVQAAIETVLYALTIKWSSDRRLQALKQLWLDAVYLAPAAGLLAALISTSSLAEASTLERWTFVAVAPLLLIVWIAVTTLMGTAYALHRHVALARTYLISALILPLGVLLLRGLGARAFLFALLIDKLASLASLSLDAQVRRFAAEVLASKSAQRPIFRVLEDYFPVLTPRLTLLLLSPGLVAAGSWLLVPSELAGFKVSLSFVTAAASMVPISQYVLQAHWMSASRKDMDREIKLVLGGVLIAGIVLGAGLWFFGDALRGFVLRTRDPALRRFDVVFLAVPLFVLIGPLSSLLIARDRVRTLVPCFLASLSSTALATAAAGPSWGFVAGATAFALTAAFSVASPVRQQRSD